MSVHPGHVRLMMPLANARSEFGRLVRPTECLVADEVSVDGAGVLVRYRLASGDEVREVYSAEDLRRAIACMRALLAEVEQS